MQGYNIGYYIRRIRKERGICQEVLYEGLCSRSTLHRIESGEQQPGLFVASQLLQRLGLDESSFLLPLGPQDFEISNLQKEIISLNAQSRFAEALEKIARLTFAGVEYEVSVDDKGETTYTILDSSKEGAQEIYEAAISENNRRIEQVWEENALSKFAEKKKLSIDFENAKYGLVQFNCKLTGITVDELAKKLKYQVVEKTEKDHKHDWMYFDVTDEEGNEKLFRCCQSCERWRIFEAE